MIRDEVRYVVGTMIAEIFELESGMGELYDELNLELLGDSLQHLELRAAILKKFSKQVDPEKARTFGQLVTEIYRAMESKRST
jgi:acyl carrier protein